MNSRGELGRRGETAALEYLRGFGMELVVRNWRSGHLEVDLIMEDAVSIRIVEVKTLRCGDGFDPSENVTADKKGNQIRCGYGRNRWGGGGLGDLSPRCFRCAGIGWI